MKRLWVDDVRSMPESYNALAKTYEEAIDYLKTGQVELISLDHDLGTEKSGYDIAVWIEEKAFSGEISTLEWRIHSANPVGRKRIEQSLSNADRYWNKGH